MHSFIMYSISTFACQPRVYKINTTLIIIIVRIMIMVIIKIKKTLAHCEMCVLWTAMPLKLCVEHLGSGYLTCYVTN